VASHRPDDEFVIEPASGAILMGSTTRIEPYTPRDTVERLLSDRPTTQRDMRDGYAWVDIHDVTFSGRAAGLSLGFHTDVLTQARWGLDLARKHRSIAVTRPYMGTLAPSPPLNRRPVCLRVVAVPSAPI